MTVDETSLLRMFEGIVPAEQWRELQREGRAAQIYSLPVVVAMMLLQRLQERGSQQAAVHQIAAGNLDRLLPDSKRVREATISQGTAGYARACARLAVPVLQKVCDDVLRELGQRMQAAAEDQPPMLLLDGTSLSLEHARGLLQAFPPARNQHGQGHWGILKLVALHDLRTGIALRPSWGPMYGPEAVSEQQLAEEAMEPAPPGSVIIGDGNFGIFSFAYTATQRQHPVLFRLTSRRAQALGAAALLPRGERRVCWRPSRKERSKYPQLPAEAQIEGRLIAVSQNGFRQPLYLFTTLSEPAEMMVAWYGQRWNMELDLRTLKRTMHLHHLRGKSRTAVEKELLIAVVAYALVRACMSLAARRAAIAPRRLSFTRAYGLLDAMIGKLCSPVPEERQQGFDRILRYMSQAKLPQRSRPRAYPRAVWGFRQDFPTRPPLQPEEEK
jgi:hypothetical protein